MTDFQDKILKISKKLKLAHIGSSLTAVAIIEEIFKVKKPDEKFILSAGHSALALAVILYDYDKAEQLMSECMHAGSEWCDASTGSLGHGFGIAIGMALSDRTKNVYCMISDGECSEGSIWESLRIAKEQNLTNLRVYCNANGWASYQAVDLDYLENRIKAFGFPVDFRRTKIDDEILNKYSQLEGLGGHYKNI